MERVRLHREGHAVPQRDLTTHLPGSHVKMPMSQDRPDNPSEQRLQGAIFRPNSEQEMLKVIELAFGYRGDVTLELKSGESVHGYLFNRVLDGPRSCVELFQPGRAGSRRIPCREIHAFHFTGHDTASGESWETWVRKRLEENDGEG